MRVSVFTDGGEERRVRHIIATLRPEGTRCCVPDVLEARHDTFRLCCWQECGTRGRSTAVGVCRKPQRPTDFTSCFDLLRKYLSEEEQVAYEKAVRTETTEAFAKTQLALSKRIYRRMRDAFHEGWDVDKKRNAVYSKVWKQIQMAGYITDYKKDFQEWLNKDVDE